MPGGLRYFTKDPNGKSDRWSVRPKGVYYYRGKGRWSKYGVERDVVKKAMNWKVDIVGLYKGSRRRCKIPQTGDGNLGR